MIIRKMNISDIDCSVPVYQYIREYQDDILKGYFAKQSKKTDAETIKKIVENSDNICLAAVVDDKIVGILLSERKKSNHLLKPEVCQLLKLGVKEGFKNKKIGTALLNEFIKECKAQGIQEIKVGVFNSNEIACNFYKKFGFKEQEQKMSLKL